ncbi:NAD(P)H-dependent oxidoreductase [Chitinophagaceae bacterium LB-8]|uniref:NAD(P)H-dependent oxidoreductase n=1 Tax=Paraflavisolibacter caeni TaxID=2982496 RepID=A0A9X3B8Q9_9BACT|nr:NAD(P)H-dependent oxidoreductase [Paraflavisolibacter caeni]MCU7550071.1 NAD(P)H-dependent oxidoreductase [Paraflavisolibacter caeni]
MKLIDALNWRYAAKRMNGEKVPQEKIDNILEATRLSASSMGLQPYTILVIENEEVKKKLQPAAYNQPQITESSHLLVFAAWENVTEEHVDEYINSIAKVRNVALESLAPFRASLMNIVNGRTQEQKYEWAARQAYIAFGTAITAAAVEEIDATPMEGFQPAAVDEILGLKEKGLRSVTILALGYRDAEKDFLVNAKKVRREADKLILKVA